MGLQVGLGDDGEGVGRGIERRGVVPVGGEARDRVAQPHAAAPAFVAELSMTVRIGLADHRQADHRAVVQVEYPIIVDEHPFGKVVFVDPLDLDVHQDPVLVAVAGDHPHQRVGPAPPEFGVPHDLLQFFVEKDVAPAPVDPGMSGGEVEGEKVGKIAAQDMLPGRVVVGHGGGGWFGWGRFGGRDRGGLLRSPTRVMPKMRPASARRRARDRGRARSGHPSLTESGLEAPTTRARRQSSALSMPGRAGSVGVGLRAGVLLACAGRCCRRECGLSCLVGPSGWGMSDDSRNDSRRTIGVDPPWRKLRCRVQARRLAARAVGAGSRGLRQFPRRADIDWR